MRVLIAGATGNTGQRLTHILTERGHTPVALVREGSDIEPLPVGTETFRADLTELPEDVCDGFDGVIFAAGSGSSTGPDATEAVDRDGARTLVDRAAAAGVKRFVMLSSIGAGDPPQDGQLSHYLEAKHQADEHLKASGLTYTIVRPVALTDEDATGRVRIGELVDTGGKAARGDVATVLADALDLDDWGDTVLDMDTRPAA